MYVEQAFCPELLHPVKDHSVPQVDGAHQMASSCQSAKYQKVNSTELVPATKENLHAPKVFVTLTEHICC